MSTETTGLIRDGEKGMGGGGRRRARESIYRLSLPCHQNDSCIQMGSDESHFNISLTVVTRDKVSDQTNKIFILFFCVKKRKKKKKKNASIRKERKLSWRAGL